MGRFMAQSLRQLIQESIDPDSWFELSDLGEGTIMTYPTTQPKKLAVYQTAEVHKKIEELLDQLRKALGEQVSIEARYLVVSENFLEDIGLDLDFSYNIGGKWGLMTFSELPRRHRTGPGFQLQHRRQVGPDDLQPGLLRRGGPDHRHGYRGQSG